MRTLSEYQAVLDNYKKYNIPLDGQWGDIDYMHNYRNFKVDLLHFGDLRNYINDLYNTSSRVKFIPIVDPAIAARPLTTNYTTYIRGIKEDVFLKSAQDGKTLIGRQWPNQAAYPDWLHPETKMWWHTELSEFRDTEVYFDGLWLDMNEPSSFCNGACYER
jgi:alpha-glucosidase (family GH31 glycosyl hydrolase)